MATMSIRISDLKEFRTLVDALGEVLRQYETLPVEALEALPAEFRAASADLRSAVEKMAAAGRTAQ